MKIQKKIQLTNQIQQRLINWMQKEVISKFQEKDQRSRKGNSTLITNIEKGKIDQSGANAFRKILVKIKISTITITYKEQMLNEEIEQKELELRNQYHNDLNQFYKKQIEYAQSLEFQYIELDEATEKNIIS
ncbi:unnamed protein product [Paramecium pentaurelia]|uniref:Uncharacterized protein n=1 Tax=Paramecium pentaurelia TaxID=43138 RepID=A0A8S1UL01_9CILI|nr:unnamed protein product [Paramecium pentaurelia]